jgi:TonB family protein
LENYELVYYITVTPEKEAYYLGGREALVALLKANLNEKTRIISQDKLEPGQVSFTVTRDGTVDHVKLTSSCGYETIDEALVEQIRTMPQRWTPATNSKGENVDQVLVFFFGMQGC